MFSAVALCCLAGLWLAQAASAAGLDASGAALRGTANVCSIGNAAIPDNDPTGVSSTVVIPSSSAGAIDDLNVTVELTHTWVGDLSVALTHSSFGYPDETQVLIDRPGTDGSTAGCAADDILVTVDDEGSDAPIEEQCNASSPAIGGVAPGGDPPDTVLLANFDGRNVAGEWTLTVVDGAVGDIGTLFEWCLNAETTTGPVFPFWISNLTSIQEPNQQFDGLVALRNGGFPDFDWMLSEENGARTADGALRASREGAWEAAMRQGGLAPQNGELVSLGSSAHPLWLRPHGPPPTVPANPVGVAAEGFGFSRSALGEADRPRPGGAPWSRSAQAADRGTPIERSATRGGGVTMTHSASQAIVAVNSSSCNDAGNHLDNSYLRIFDLEAFGIPQTFEVREVEVGIERADSNGAGTQPLDVNLYTWDPATAFVFANLVPIGSTSTAVADQTLSIVTVPVEGTVPQFSTLVVEVFTPDGQAAGNSLFLGSNPDGQTSPTYLAAPGCGIPEPIDAGVPPANAPNMHLVLNVTGDIRCSSSDDIPWLSLSQTSGTLSHFEEVFVDATLDSTGLSAGTYVGTVCVDVQGLGAQIELPARLRVEVGILFLDGFESGDTTSWTTSTP